MPDPKITVEEIDASETPYATLHFDNGQGDASVKISLEFDGNWLSLFEGADASEDEARHGFAGELFAAITNLFT